MRIFHYSLGFPPYRTGGLTKFCVDLMNQQLKDGHEVAMLWPGSIHIFGQNTKIISHKPVGGIGNYEVINPAPVPFDEGIKDFGVFMKEGARKAYDAFLAEKRPDIIHIHTVMGLHKNLLIAAKEKNIKLVFTTHDFFPICPKVTMFRHGAVCSSIETCEECGVCNSTALDLKKLQILHSPVYRILKDSKLVSIMRKRHRDEYLCDDDERKEECCVGSASDYKQLRRFYQSMLSMMDIIHYNSSVTKKVYENIFGELNSCLISITHSDIADHRKRKTYNTDEMRIRYLGPYGGAKGYFLLKATLDTLWQERQDFCLDIHFTPHEVSPYMIIHHRYGYDELEKIFDETDVLITPSIWYETFGYTVLEALSYGVPVIISGNVGAKDILCDNAGIVVDDISSEKLLEVVRTLTPNKLISMNDAIINTQKIMTISDMAARIMAECYMEGL